MHRPQRILNVSSTRPVYTLNTKRVSGVKELAAVNGGVSRSGIDLMGGAAWLPHAPFACRAASPCPPFGQKGRPSRNTPASPPSPAPATPRGTPAQEDGGGGRRPRECESSVHTAPHDKGDEKDECTAQVRLGNESRGSREATRERESERERERERERESASRFERKRGWE